MTSRTIKDYTIVSAAYDPDITAATLEKRMSGHVKDLIAEGWQPHGPLVANTSDDGSIFAQAMVKYG